MDGAKLPAVTMLYGIGASLDTRVRSGVGIACPTAQLIVCVVPPETVSLEAVLVICKVIGNGKSP